MRKRLRLKPWGGRRAGRRRNPAYPTAHSAGKRSVRLRHQTDAKDSVDVAYIRE